MADLGGPEILVLVIAVALLFGWKRMPDMARSLGRSLRIFTSELDQLRADEAPGSGTVGAPGRTSTRTPED